MTMGLNLMRCNEVCQCIRVCVWVFFHVAYSQVGGTSRDVEKVDLRGRAGVLSTVTALKEVVLSVSGSANCRIYFW